MTRSIAATLLLSSGLCLSAGLAVADGEKIEFSGGTFTIAENADMEKILSFDGKELDRDYVVYLDRIVQVGAKDIALFGLAPGGNACGPDTLIVWRPDADKPVETVRIGDGCGAPQPAVTGNAIYFVPYLLPGQSDLVRSWSPREGLGQAGELNYAPVEGTAWADLEPGKMQFMLDAFRNQDVYEYAQALLGDDMETVVRGLVVGGGFEVLAPGIFSGSGCVPHACGASNSFIALQPAEKGFYMAQQQDDGGVKAWPDEAAWPAEILKTMKQALE